jgi:peptide-methionine (S)-S-oxide reductase
MHLLSSLGTLGLSLSLAALGCSTVVSQDAPVAKAAGPSRPTAALRVGTDPGHAGAGTPLAPRPGNELAAFAMGCFWGSENTFRHVPGVVATGVGYTGGRTTSPTYESVCTHTTGHAETVLVEFDPSRVTYRELLAVFFRSHDPTTRNRQGPDVGDQYRSAIFTFSEAQIAAARAAMAEAGAQAKRPITTEIQPMGAFWLAEDYHQQYDEKVGHASCPMPGAEGI